MKLTFSRRHSVALRVIKGREHVTIGVLHVEVSAHGRA
jgi:hypothetical protein